MHNVCFVRTPKQVAAIADTHQLCGSIYSLRDISYELPNPLGVSCQCSYIFCIVEKTRNHAKDDTEDDGDGGDNSKPTGKVFVFDISRAIANVQLSIPYLSELCQRQVHKVGDEAVRQIFDVAMKVLS